MRRLTAVIASVCLALAGCQRQPLPPIVYVNQQGLEPSAVSLGDVTVDSRPLELTGFELSAEERARLQKERSESISNAAAKAANPRHLDIGTCALKTMGLCALVLPFVLPITMGIMYSGEYIKGSLTTADVMSAGEGAEYAAVLRAEATSTSLRTRIVRIADKQPGYPRIVVRLKSAELAGYDKTFLAIKLTATTQAGDATSEHRGEYALRRDRAAFAPGVQEALDYLALSVIETYLPSHPSAREWREWQGLLLRPNDSAGLEAFVERYPDGRFASTAREMLGRARCRSAGSPQPVEDCLR